MTPGPKRNPPAVKRDRGTYRPDRDGGMVEYIVPGSPPQMPDYLSAEATAVWQENIGRVLAAGVTELDSDLFARYCSLEAMLRRAFASGEAPPAAFITAQRQMAELLRIAGPRSRVGVRSEAAATNPFAKHGRRPDDPHGTV